MKATRQEKPVEFVPVTLTLETQQEVDAVFAFFNHDISDSVLQDTTENRYYQILKPFADPETASEFHGKLCRFIAE